MSDSSMDYLRMVQQRDRHIERLASRGGPTVSLSIGHVCSDHDCEVCELATRVERAEAALFRIYLGAEEAAIAGIAEQALGEEGIAALVAKARGGAAGVGVRRVR